MSPEERGDRMLLFIKKDLVIGFPSSALVIKNSRRKGKKVLKLRISSFLEAIKGIKDLSRKAIDPEGRHWKNALDLMMSDGILNILPKKDDAWVDFVRPFLRLTRIEKDFYKNKKHE